MQLNIFAEETQLARLTQLGDSLEKLKVVDFEKFRPMLNKAFKKERKSTAGRPPFDYVMMFKVLVLQRLFNLSDEQTEYQITDRMSFMRFLGLTMGEKAPDAKTIWNYKNTLSETKVIEEVFLKFNEELEEQGLITHKGTMIDATFVEAPRQRNTREENKQIQEGEVPQEWEGNAHKIAQKDTEASWTKKKETHYGYKNHIKADVDSKLITEYSVTTAATHDSNEFTKFLNETDRVVYADSAYTGKEIPSYIQAEVCEKGYRNKKLTEEQKENNRRKSKVRCRVEHIFGFMTNTMRGITVRSKGMKRARMNVGLTNLVYNFFRYAYLSQKIKAKG